MKCARYTLRGRSRGETKAKPPQGTRRSHHGSGHNTMDRDRTKKRKRTGPGQAERHRQGQDKANRNGRGRGRTGDKTSKTGNKPNQDKGRSARETPQQKGKAKQTKQRRGTREESRLQRGLRNHLVSAFLLCPVSACIDPSSHICLANQVSFSLKTNPSRICHELFRPTESHRLVCLFSSGRDSGLPPDRRSLWELDQQSSRPR